MIEAILWDFGGVLTSSPFEAFNRFEQARNVRIITVIAADSPAFAARFGDEARRGINGALAVPGCSTCHVDRATLFAESNCDALTNATAGAGDDGYFPVHFPVGGSHTFSLSSS